MKSIHHLLRSADIFTFPTTPSKAGLDSKVNTTIYTLKDAPNLKASTNPLRLFYRQ
ncbi:MAG: hypothetical protein ACW97Z_15855 [Candidatus Hodarchaeales archaeon]